MNDNNNFSLTTERLYIRNIVVDDAEFIVELLNEPQFLQYIGDKEIRTLADAINYIKTGPQQMFSDNGFALHVVFDKTNDQAIGFCGLLKREVLEHPDLGFAFLQRFCGQGFGYEAAKAVLDYEVNQHNLSMVLAITAIENSASKALLEKLGFVFKEQLHIAGYDGDSKLYVFQ